MADWKTFRNADHEPFAVFHWGADGHGITKEFAVSEFEDDFDMFGFTSERLMEYASEPKQFWMRKQDEPDAEDYPWEICSETAEGATPAFGVIFNI